jgi:hypothetical protein
VEEDEVPAVGAGGLLPVLYARRGEAEKSLEFLVQAARYMDVVGEAGSLNSYLRLRTEDRAKLFIAVDVGGPRSMNDPG